MAKNMNKAPTLLAEQPEDLEVFAAQLQDAIVRVGDIAFLPHQHRLAMLVNRFRLEEVNRETMRPWKGRRFHRVTTGIHFDTVLKVQAHNPDQSDTEALLDLLHLEFAPNEDGAGIITLIFAGGAELRLQVECVDATLTDRGAAWKTKHLPNHEDERS